MSIKKSRLELSFETLWKQLSPGEDRPRAEFQFHATRKWRFDFCWVRQMVAVECEGGVHSGGRHVRGKGFEGDVEKYNAAAAAGWRVFRITAGMLQRDPGAFIDQVKMALKSTT